MDDSDLSVTYAIEAGRGTGWRERGCRCRRTRGDGRGGGGALSAAEGAAVANAADKLIRVDDPAEPYVAHVEFQPGRTAGLDERGLLDNVPARRGHRRLRRGVVFLLRLAAVTRHSGNSAFRKMVELRRGAVGGSVGRIASVQLTDV